MFDFIKRAIAPPIGRYLINAVSSSLKMKVVGFENYRFVKDMGKKCVIVFWHGQQFYPIYHFRDRKIAIMVSLSRDGEIQNRILSSFGYGVVRGSSSRGAVSGLIGMIKKMREGYDLAMALDGPRGPLHEAKEGVSYIAIKEDCCILPIACAFNSFKLFSSSWDQYIFPYPYSEGVMLVGRPIMPTKLKVPAMTHKHLEKILNAMTGQAENMVKNGMDAGGAETAAPGTPATANAGATLAETAGDPLYDETSGDGQTGVADRYPAVETATVPANGVEETPVHAETTRPETRTRETIIIGEPPAVNLETEKPHAHSRSGHDSRPAAETGGGENDGLSTETKPAAEEECQYENIEKFDFDMEQSEPEEEPASAGRATPRTPPDENDGRGNRDAKPAARKNKAPRYD